MSENKWDYNKEVCQLFIDFEKAYDSIKNEYLYDILIKFGVPNCWISQEIFRWNS
jgi:hypothetical protein